MKLIHLSDLHLGKRVHEVSMLEDQKYILDKILEICDDISPDAVMIAGDIYDKSIPPAEAVILFDEFLTALSIRSITVMLISGNHDSAERIAFGGRLMKNSGVFVSPVYSKDITPVVLSDEYGEVRFYLLPFIKPLHVRLQYPESDITTYTEALDMAIKGMNIDTSVRNVLISHQFVTGAQRCESETISVGGSDNVDAAVFQPFDYTALGHLHGPQQVSCETIRYCGTPLKYSFSECGHEKSVTVIEMLEKGNTKISTIPLVPMRDMREIRGTYEELTLRKNYAGTNTDDYVKITLTDEDDIPNAFEKLRTIYNNALSFSYDNKRTRTGPVLSKTADPMASPITLFNELYEQMNNQPMSEKQTELAEKLIKEIWGYDE